MREDHIEYGIDATSYSYFIPVAVEEGQQVFGPDMAAVRRARHSLNRRHFPKHAPSYQGAAPALQSVLERKRTQLERMADRVIALYELDASPATLAAAVGAAKRVAKQIEDIEERRARADRRAQVVDHIPSAMLIEKYTAERNDLSARIRRARANAQRSNGRHTAELIEELQNQRLRVSRMLNAVERKASVEKAKLNDHRPERDQLVSQKMIVGSFDDTNDTEPVGFAVFSTWERIERPVLDVEGNQVEVEVEVEEGDNVMVPKVERTYVERFYVTQFIYRNVKVRNQAEVHKLNVSYLMGGEPMKYAPKSKVYRVIEPAEAWHGPFASADDAEQLAANWQSECRDIYNDSDRILGRDVEPTSGRPVSA
jgi:hypothetical protein